MFVFVLLMMISTLVCGGITLSTDCNITQARIGQYYCAQPQIDDRTQSAVNCTENRRVLVPCYAIPGVTICNIMFSESGNESFVFNKESVFDHSGSASCCSVSIPTCPLSKLTGSLLLCSYSKLWNQRIRNGGRYSYTTALGLSLFLGMFGIDRFYLGYPAIGLVKLCTFGFFFAGQLVDFLLILIQYVTPSDRSDYNIPFYGPVLHELSDNNETYFAT